MELLQENWSILDGKKIKIFTIGNSTKTFEVKITNIGATIVSIKIPDKNGKIGLITAGRNTANEIIENIEAG